VSFRHAIIFTVLIAVLLPYYLYVDQRSADTAEPVRRQDTILKLNSIDALTLIRGPRRVRYEKTADGKLYRVAEPANGFIPQDLMQAMAALLISAKEVEVVAEGPSDLREFGLDQPRAEIVVETPDAREPIHIYFGSLNPTHSAIYAQVRGQPKVFLLGRNADYYQSLIFQWIEGKQGRDA
jgi:hypothetical protein